MYEINMRFVGNNSGSIKEAFPFFPGSSQLYEMAREYLSGRSVLFDTRGSCAGNIISSDGFIIGSYTIELVFTPKNSIDGNQT